MESNSKRDNLKVLSNICSYIFEKKQVFFGVIHNTEGNRAEQRIKHAAALQRKPARREEKGDPQAGQRGRLFAAGISIAACFSCASRLETAV